MQSATSKITPHKKALFNKVASQPIWLNTFIDVYQRLSTDNLALLKNVYHQDIVFIDPLHQLKGLPALENYFSGLYTNLTYCQFNIEQVIYQQVADENLQSKGELIESAAIYWTMSFQHPKLNKGKMITVNGNSSLKGCNDKVLYHRDYLDAGAMLYEHLPILGKLVKWFKKQASK